jgi:DUF4097 and DUF4098 domain-containing protein YvlB
MKAAPARPAAQIGRIALPLLTAGIFLAAVGPARAAANERIEKQFNVTGHPVVVIQNVASGRIEVKSWKNAHQVDIIGTQASNKIGFEIEQVGDRVDVNANVLDPSAQPIELEANLQLSVPEETELQLKTETGLIYVEQVAGDMKLESYGGDVHLKEVSGYVIVKTTGGSLICTQCAGKLDFSSISGNAQLLQPQLNNVNVMTTTGNILFDGAFVRTGLYSMRSGKGLVEVRFSSNDSFDLKAQTSTGIVDNRAADFLRPDDHKSRNFASRAIHGFVGTVGAGLAKVELSSYSGTIRIMRRD